LDQHLYQEAGHWHLHLRGDDLKIGTRQGRVNTYHVDLTDYCPEFLPLLEEFLTVYRPRLPNPTGSTLLFLSHRGKPFSQVTLGSQLSATVAMHTGQRFYPHLIRTIWATEWIQKYHDYDTAAAMLGDTVGVVIAAYRHLVEEEQHAIARQGLAELLKPERKAG
jgi:site-specific recombinase XerD